LTHANPFCPPTRWLQATGLLIERAASISQSSAGALQLPPEAEYAMLRLQLEHISNDATAALPAAANLFRDKALERLTPGSSAVAAKVARMEKLERQLYQGQRPALRPDPDPRLATAVAALACFEIERLQAFVMRLAQQVGIKHSVWGWLRVSVQVCVWWQWCVSLARALPLPLPRRCN
jgi:hypothetical protein